MLISNVIAYYVYVYIYIYIYIYIWMHLLYRAMLTRHPDLSRGIALQSTRSREARRISSVRLESLEQKLHGKRANSFASFGFAGESVVKRLIICYPNYILYIYICVCVYIYYIYIYMYMHTHTHAYTHTQKGRGKIQRKMAQNGALGVHILVIDRLNKK